jgi:hypothetical protein
MASFTRGVVASSPSQGARKAAPQPDVHAAAPAAERRAIPETHSSSVPAATGSMFEGMATAAPVTPTPVAPNPPVQAPPPKAAPAPVTAPPVASQPPPQSPVKATPVKVAPAKPPAPVEVCATIKELASDVIAQYEVQARDLAAEYSFLGEEARSMKLELEKEEISGRMLQQRVEDTEAQQAKLAEAEDFESADALSTEVSGYDHIKITHNTEHIMIENICPVCHASLADYVISSQVLL